MLLRRNVVPKCKGCIDLEGGIWDGAKSPTGRGEQPWRLQGHDTDAIMKATSENG